MNYKKILESKKSQSRWSHNFLDKENHNLKDFLCRNVGERIYKNFYFSEIYGEHYLLGYFKVIGIFKKNSLFLKSLMGHFIYQSAVPYLSSGFMDKGEFISFSGINYHKNFLKPALKILGNKKDILIRVPVSEIAPIILFTKKDHHLISVAPFFLE